MTNTLPYRYLPPVDRLRACAANALEEIVTGAREDVQIEFGLKADRETPRRDYLLEGLSPEPEKFLQVLSDETQRLRQLDRRDAKKDKSKRKQAKKVRKK